MATAKAACLYARKSCSNRATLGPVPSHPVSRQSRTSFFSSSPIDGDPKTKNLSGLRTGLAVLVMIDPESPDSVFERVIVLDRSDKRGRRPSWPPPDGSRRDRQSGRSG